MIPENSTPANGNQHDLFDHGRHAQETRQAAHEAAKPKAAQRRCDALEALAQAGDQGLTRHELADAIGVPLQSICSVALDLLRNGLATEAGAKRPTPTGSPAAVMTITDLGRGAVIKEWEAGL